MIPRFFYFLLAFLGVVVAAGAAVVLPPVFSDGMVLQRGRAIPVWGTAGAGERVTVEFHAQKVTAKADETGAWRAQLAAEEACATPGELRVSGAGETVRIGHVVVGDLWLIAGQSNMEFPLSKAMNAPQVIAKADVPLLREFKIKTGVADGPGQEAQGDWRVCSPETAGKFSAVGYFVGRRLCEQLKIPVGIINATWGGSVIEGWLDVNALRGQTVPDRVLARWEKDSVEMPKLLEQWRTDYRAWRAASEAAKAAGKPFDAPAPKRPLWKGDKATPGGIFYAMVYPVRALPVRGVLWYQGESNAVRADEYADLLTRLIAQWRAAFGNGELPFYIVQLPPYNKKDDPTGLQWARLREAQASVAASVPGARMVVTIDLGQEADSIHPRGKQTLSRRLSDLVLAQSYGQKLPADYPRIERVEMQGDSARVQLSHAEGLFSKTPEVTGFAVAGADRVFLPAQASIEGDCVLVKIPAGAPQPVAVRYAWGNVPESPSLYNGQKLPVAPFRSDDW